MCSSRKDRQTKCLALTECHKIQLCRKYSCKTGAKTEVNTIIILPQQCKFFRIKKMFSVLQSTPDCSECPIGRRGQAKSLGQLHGYVRNGFMQGTVNNRNDTDSNILVLRAAALLWSKLEILCNAESSFISKTENWNFKVEIYSLIFVINHESHKNIIIAQFGNCSVPVHALKLATTPHHIATL